MTGLLHLLRLLLIFSDTLCVASYPWFVSLSCKISVRITTTVSIEKDGAVVVVEVVKKMKKMKKRKQISLRSHTIDELAKQRRLRIVARKSREGLVAYI